MAQQLGHRHSAVALSPMEAWLRTGVLASPFRNILGLLNPPASALPAAAAGGSSFSDQKSPRLSNAESAAESEILSLGSLKPVLCAEAGKDFHSSSSSSREGQSVVMVAFDANVKEVSHAGIVWAMEHVLKRGDTLMIVSVLDSVRGPWGYRTKIGDQKWQSANQKLIDEIQQKMEAWRSFRVLDRRCTEGGVKLVVMVKAAQRGDLAICQEAMKQGARHVVLDRSLKNVRREFYFQNLSCDVTRMRKSGGVDVIRPGLDMAMLMDLAPRTMNFPTSRRGHRSPASGLPPPRLSYSDQIDEFEISLGSSTEYKRRFCSAARSSSAAAPPLPKYPSGKLKSGKFSRHLLSSPSPPEHSSSISPSTSSVPSFASAPSFTASCSSRESKASESSRHFPSSAILAKHSSSSTLSQSTPSSVPSFVSSNAIERDMDDDEDLFSIFHGSTRHTGIDTDAFSNMGYGPRSSGYESDDLFSIGNASTRCTVVLPEYHLGHRLSSSSIPDISMTRTSRRSSTEGILFTPSVKE